MQNFNHNMLKHVLTQATVKMPPDLQLCFTENLLRCLTEEVRTPKEGEFIDDGKPLLMLACVWCTA